jgi:phage baseplate assembly protein W
MVGIDRHTGKMIERPEHIIQSIEVILTTPVGTRVMRRELGVAFLDEDGSFKAGTSAEDIARDALSTLEKYEPRIRNISVIPEMVAGELHAINVEYTDIEEGVARKTTVKFR